MTRFVDLETAAAKLPSDTTLGETVSEIVDSARINADDTVYTEKAQPESEWDNIALATVEEKLAYGSFDAAVYDWFEAHGVRW